MASKIALPSSSSRLPQPSRLCTPKNLKRSFTESTDSISSIPEKKCRQYDTSNEISNIKSDLNIMPCPSKRPPAYKGKAQIGKLRRSVSMAAIPAPSKTLGRSVPNSRLGFSTLGVSNSDLQTRSSSVTAAMIQQHRSTTASSIARQPGANITNRGKDIRLPTKNGIKGNDDATEVTKGKTKRLPWDLKGRLMDMEEKLKMNSVKLSDYDLRMASLEAEKTSLSENLQQTKTYSAGAEEEIANLKLELRNEKEQRYSEKVLLERRLADVEFLNSTKERQVAALESELQLKTEEISGLKSSISMHINNKISIDEELKVLKSRIEEVTAERNKLDILCQQHEESIKDMSNKIVDGETSRRKLHNLIQELKGNIRVFCRVRPLIGEEIKKNGSDQIHHINFLDEKSLELIKNANLDGSSMSGIKNRLNNHEFSFDHIFTPKDSQADVFEEISQLAQSALDGYNVCIFAYGQTGSGKTFTMEGVYGDENREGMIPKTVKLIFKAITELQNKGWMYKLEASFLEIYNETIRDLLVSHKESKQLQYDVKFVDEKKSDIYVTNLKIVPVECVEEVHNLLNIAQHHRVVASTNMNEHSSRSHSVFQLKISGKNLKTGTSCEGTLNLVDLAGSERLKESGSEGVRLTETLSINKSLANLGNVIMALAQKQSHIPYRNSKLTHLLQNYLGGNSKTLMFVNVSPLDNCFNETLNSLRFAAKVNESHIGVAVKQIKK